MAADQQSPVDGRVRRHRGLNQVLPIPFNQPNIASPQMPINGETSSYGFNVIPTETLHTYDGGNTDLRVPYLGFNTNSAFYKAEGIATYNALQLGLRKRLSRGLEVTAAYTWSHTLDMQSGLGLFFNGNDPFNLHNFYDTPSYDRTHVAIIQYFYELLSKPGTKVPRRPVHQWMDRQRRDCSRKRPTV